MIYLVTTTDNPYNPFTQWDAWYAWDEAAGYHTSGLMARLAHTSADLPEPEQDAELQRVVDEIVRENVTGVYTKVASPD